MFASSPSSPIVCIAWTLIHSIWQGAFIWVIYRVARMTLRDAAWRVHLGHAALLIFVVAQCATFAHMMSGGELTRVPIDGDLTLVQVARFDANTGRLPLPRLAPTERLGTWIAAQERYLPFVVAAWGIGLTLQIARTLGAYYLLQRHLNACRQVGADLRERFASLTTRMGLRRAVSFLESELVVSPATARWLKPVVLVPIATLLQMSPQHLDALILHELAHIKRWDYATNILRTFVSALFFFHPLVRDICGRTADDAEAATDALAAHVFGDDKVYAEALLALAELRRLQPMLLGANGGDLRERILRLLRRQSLPAATVGSRASLGGTLLSGVVGMLLLANTTAWAVQNRDTMNRVTQRSFEEIVVESLSRNVPSEAFIGPFATAMEEVRAREAITTKTVDKLTDALLEGVDPHVVYRRMCEIPGPVNFELFRTTYLFGPFGFAQARRAVVEEMIRDAEAEPDPARAARIARATLVFTSLMVPTDSGYTASQLLRNPKFIPLLQLSPEDYHLFRLMAAVNNERSKRLGSIIVSERRNPAGATDAEVEAFAAEMPHMPAFQLTLCNVMPIRFQRRVLAVLKRDESRYPPGSVRFALERAARE